MKLLIVDDEYFAVQGVLDGVNWEALAFSEVLTAYSYAQAVEVFEKTEVDILLCDIEMPDESGLDLIEWVNAHSPKTKCIILSCHSEFDFARQALQLDCMDYVLKPVRYEALTELLKRAEEEAARSRHRSMMENYGQLYLDHKAKEASRDYVDIFEQVSGYIDTHLDSEMSVRGLADMVYVSADHLTRTFKKKCGKTVTDYILQRRMELAGELLKKPELTVTMVSDSVGFGNYSYFTEQFKKFYGMTPREYQKQFK